MAVYAIGDIQGCYRPLQDLLGQLEFDPERDRLWFTGDLVNRGPDSLEVLRFVHDLGDRAVVVLGNHDLHLLAVWAGQARTKRNDSLDGILRAPDRDQLMDWLRSRPLLHEDPDLGAVLVHAGIPPAWDLATARRCAREVEAVLRGPDHVALFGELYGDEPAQWDPALRGTERLRFIINAFTRMRYCDTEGRLEMDCKQAPGTQPAGYLPWFEVPGRRYDAAAGRIVCGHWSTLGYRQQPGLLALDTGCLWGGQLTAVRLDDPDLPRYSLPCKPMIQPGPRSRAG